MPILPIASPTQLSLAHLRKLGYDCDVVEKWKRVQWGWVRSDLLGFGDILGFKGEDVVLVQTTDTGDIQKRIRKIQASKWLPIVCAAKWTVLAHGWRKGGPRGKKKEWVLTEKVIVP